MNNRGFGLSEMLGILFVFIVCILIIIIISTNNFKGVIPSSKVNNSVDNTDPNSDSKRFDYTKFESIMEKGAKLYVKQELKEHQEQISLEELIDANYVTPIIDPIKNEACLGYVIHSIEENSYKAYLRCPGSYRTAGYEPVFES